MHSYQNALYFAAQMLRSLAAGEAYASFVDNAGLHSARVYVPRVKPLPVADDTFVAIRELIFAGSPSATDTENATARLQQYENQLLIEARNAPEGEPEPDSPSDFRVPVGKSRKKKP